MIDKVNKTMTSSVNHEVTYRRHIHFVDSTLNTVSKKLKLDVREFLFNIAFLLSFVLGKLVQWTAPDEEVNNYYNDKRNLFNQIFVKKGWGWTTVVIVVFYSLLFLTGENPKLQTPQQRRKAIGNGVVKYFAATAWWVLYTQWCFGLPIMDRIFVYTGGKCTAIQHEHLSKGVPKFKDSGLFHMLGSGLEFESKRISSLTCRKLKGNWQGGHDPSGHVFLLVHSSLYLFLETFPFVVSWSKFVSLCKLLRSRWSQGMQGQATIHFLVQNPQLLVHGLIALWWFMLFMTNIYFHSVFEKLVGLIFGYTGILFVYLLPRWLS